MGKAEHATLASAQAWHCPECGALARDSFCGGCGAPREEAHTPPTLRRLAADVLHEITSVDSKLMATVRALVFRPGELMRVYLRGPRRRYLAPFKVFLLANVVYFFAAGISPINTFATPLDVQVTTGPASALEEALVERKLAREGEERQQLAPRWDAVTDAHARMLTVLMVPIYAIVFGLLLAWKRAPAVEHVVFATHFMAFCMLLLAGLGIVVQIVFVSGHGLGFLSSDGAISLLVLALLTLYTVLAVRRGYGVGWGAALLVAAGAAAAALPAILLYRFLLFFTVYPMV